MYRVGAEDKYKYPDFLLWLPRWENQSSEYSFPSLCIVRGGRRVIFVDGTTMDR